MRFCFILGCFVLSGATALLYEVAWTRAFALVFGTSEPALATVLAAYMGGLGLGALVARRMLPKVENPMRVYALLECGIAASALLVPLAIRGLLALNTALLGVGPELAEAGRPAELAFQISAALLILLVPTALMGATLPVLVRSVVEEDSQLGVRVGLLYAGNTFGAVIGALATAFVLLPGLGLARAGHVGVLASLFVALLAALVPRRRLRLPAPPRADAEPIGDRAASSIGPLMAVSGAVALGYEIIWTRLLVHVVGATVQAFALMLGCFLCGLALGGLLGARSARQRAGALHAWVKAQSFAAVLSVAGFAAIDGLPLQAARLASEPSAVRLVGMALAACLLMPGIVALGATFPLAVRIAACDDVDAGSASARVYGWNTLGALVGSLGMGFVALPALGFAGAVLLCAATGLALACVAALQTERRRPQQIALAVCLAAVLLWLGPGEPMHLLRTSPFDLRAGQAGLIGEAEVAYLATGRGASVLMLAHDAGFDLRTNGLPEAAIRRAGYPPIDDAAQWLVALPLLARPEATRLLVVGLGGGSLLEAIPESVERLDVLELEAEVLAANQRIAGERAVDPLADPRVRVALNDARGALATTRARWDVIVSQPSHPWTAGASHLFTREFFAAAAEHLDADGVFAQWMGLDFVDADLLRGLVASLGAVFPNVEVYWLPSTRAVVCMGSRAPIAMREGVRATLAARPDAFDHLGVHALEDVIALRVVDAEGAVRFAAGATPSTDDRNLFQMRSRGSERLDTDAVVQLFAETDPMRVADLSLDPYRLARRLLSRGARGRVEGLRDTWPDASVRAGLNGLLDLADGAPDAAENAFVRALSGTKPHPEARIGLARAVGFDLARLDGRASRDVTTLARAIEAASVEQWDAVARLDAELAAIPETSALYPEALRLRAGWRIATGGRAGAWEAIAFIDRLLPIEHRIQDRVFRARALARAGRSDLALGTLADLIRHTRDTDPTFVGGVIEALAEIEESEALTSRRSALAVALAARLEGPAG